MTREEAERLRAFLGGTEPADLAADLPVLQRIGRTIAKAIYRPYKRGS